jgi:hypothetical protein
MKQQSIPRVIAPVEVLQPECSSRSLAISAMDEWCLAIHEHISIYGKDGLRKEWFDEVLPIKCMSRHLLL